MGSMKKLTSERTKLLTGLLNVYASEVKAIYAVYSSWSKLKEDAKDKCAEDFDQALVARETLLEELLDAKDDELDVGQFEVALKEADKMLLGYHKVVKEIYGLDAKAFLNVKPPKLLKK